MQVSKRVLCPERLRRVSRPFGWVDVRLIREERLKGCSPTAWGLYLFWVTVADAQGLSYYSDTSVARRMGISLEAVATGRSELIRAGLVAYEAPLIQVLALDRPEPSVRRPLPSAAGILLGDVMRSLAGGAQ
jgi:hypothetical protein